MTAPAAARGHRLSVNETFLSFQGEGPSAGERAVFVRLAGCNLACSWCDTTYSWDWSRHDRDINSRSTAPADAAEEIARLAGSQCRLLVLTGGEPLLQQCAAVDMLRDLQLRRPGLRCEVETNGTVGPSLELSRLVYRYVVSPKLAHSGVSGAARLKTETLRAFARHERSVLKIVAAGADDLAEAAAVADAGGFATHRVWIMPLGEDADGSVDTARALAEGVLAAGFNLTLRLHVLLWNGASGR
jgi:7-carboxy-7-deazaguanine synthase